MDFEKNRKAFNEVEAATTAVMLLITELSQQVIKLSETSEDTIEILAKASVRFSEIIKNQMIAVLTLKRFKPVDDSAPYDENFYEECFQRELLEFFMLHACRRDVSKLDDIICSTIAKFAEEKSQQKH